jgi:hypothetical protein
LIGIDEESGGGQLLPSQNDSVLARTLLTVLGQGMTLIIYNENGAKRTKVSLAGTHICAFIYEYVCICIFVYMYKYVYMFIFIHICKDAYF